MAGKLGEKAAKRPAKKKADVPQVGNLPGISGPGVGGVSIPEIDKAYEKYVPLKDARVAASTKEVEAKEKLVSLLHAHEAEIGKDGSGTLRYKYDGKLIMIVPTDEKLKIVNSPDESGNDD